MKKYSFPRTDPIYEDALEQERKGAWQKCLLAALVKKHCQVSNPWLAKRLAMGHPAGMSKATRMYQDSEAGRKSIKHHEKYSFPRTDPILPHFMWSKCWYGIYSCKGVKRAPDQCNNLLYIK